MSAASPYAPLNPPVPVLVIGPGETLPAPAPDDARIVMEPAPHVHAGDSCVSCAATGDVRARLFDLIQSLRAGDVPPFSRVVIDARARPDSADLRALVTPGQRPLNGMRDMTVARSFRG